MENIRDSIARSRELMSSSAFDPWEGIARANRASLSLIILLLLTSI